MGTRFLFRNRNLFRLCFHRFPEVYGKVSENSFRQEEQAFFLRKAAVWVLFRACCGLPSYGRSICAEGMRKCPVLATGRNEAYNSYDENAGCFHLCEVKRRPKGAPRGRADGTRRYLTKIWSYGRIRLRRAGERWALPMPAKGPLALWTPFTLRRGLGRALIIW